MKLKCIALAAALSALAPAAWASGDEDYEWEYDRSCKNGVGDSSAWKVKGQKEWCNTMQEKRADECTPFSGDGKYKGSLESCPRACGVCEGYKCEEREDDGDFEEDGVICKDAENNPGKYCPKTKVARNCAKSCCVAWRTGTDETPSNPERFRVAALGDSNTVGYKPNNGPRQAPPWIETLQEQLEGVLGAGNVEGVNYGQSGTTATSVAEAYLDGSGIYDAADEGPGLRYDDFRGDISTNFETFGYDAIIISLGTNDAKVKYAGDRSGDGFVDGYKALITDLETRTTWKRIQALYLATPVPIFEADADNTDGDGWNGVSVSWNKEQAQEDMLALCPWVATAYPDGPPCYYIDFFEALGGADAVFEIEDERTLYWQGKWTDPSGVERDGEANQIHPGPAGAYEMASVAFEALNRTLDLATLPTPAPAASPSKPPTVGGLTPSPSAAPSKPPTAPPPPTEWVWKYERACKHGLGDSSAWKKRGDTETCNELPGKKCASFSDDTSWRGSLESCPRACGLCEGLCDELDEDPANYIYQLKDGTERGCDYVAEDPLDRCRRDEGKVDDADLPPGKVNTPSLVRLACPKACCGAWATNGVDLTPSDPNRLRVAGLGDSNTFGRQTNNGPRQAPPWLETLQGLLGGTAEVNNYGQSGTTATSVGDAYLYGEGLYKPPKESPGSGGPGWRYADFVEDVSIVCYKAVIVQLGTNDAKADFADERLGTGFTDGYKALIADIVTTTAHCPDVVLYLATPVPIFDDGDEWDADSVSWNKEQAQEDMLALCPWVATAYPDGPPCYYIDFFEALGGADAVFESGDERTLYWLKDWEGREGDADEVHPGPAGGQAMAEAAFNVLNATLVPVADPTTTPTDMPTVSPTASPEASPSKAPSKAPTASPEATPSKAPSAAPSKMPTPAGCPAGLTPVCEDNCPQKPVTALCTAALAVGECCVSTGVCAATAPADGLDCPARRPSEARALRGDAQVYQVTARGECVPCETDSQCRAVGQETCLAEQTGRRALRFGGATVSGCCAGVRAD